MQRLTGMFRAAIRIWLAFALLSAPAWPQSAFDPIVRVNAGIVTLFELDQRALFLTLLNAGEDARTLAFQQLIDERIQLDTARTLGIAIPEEQLRQAEAEFAAQGEFTREEFLAALGQSGVEAGTFRNFIEAGLVWREVVGATFANRINVTDDEIDRVLASVPSPGGVRVLVNEIALPASTPESERASRVRADRIRQAPDFDSFRNAARLFSIANSRFAGGERDWLAVEALPEAAAADIVNLRPGQVTRPVLEQKVLLLYQLRDLETVQPGRREVVSAEYAILRIPGGATEDARREAARIAAQVRTCDDLYGAARKLPPERLNRQTVGLSALPADVARELQNLDNNEVSLNLRRGGDIALLMLCRRTLNESSAVDRQLVSQLIFNQRLETFAQGYLNELKFAANIERLQ